MGRRTSVYLPDALAASVDASGLPLAELIARGVSCTGHDPGAGAAPPAKPRPKREVPQPRPAARGDACPHPKARVLKGLCGSCGRNVG